jgi:hypothetical protein
MSRFVSPIVADPVPEAHYITSWYGPSNNRPATSRPKHPLAPAPKQFECQEGGGIGTLTLLTREQAIAEAAETNAERLASGEWAEGWVVVLELKLDESECFHEFSETTEAADGKITMIIEWLVVEVEPTDQEIEMHRNVQPVAEPVAVE